MKIRMSLKSLITKAGLVWPGGPDPEIKGLDYDSRRLGPGGLFFALKGQNFDGHHFLDEVQKNGASAAIVTTLQKSSLPQIKVESILPAMSQMGKVFYGAPSKKIPVIGITGTNGKTTSTYLVEDLFKSAGKLCGVMGTINYRLGTHQVPAPNTTPMSLDIHQFLFRALNEKFDTVVMEVSSHALELNRVQDINFKIGVFTNLTQDHLDFHKDMESYFAAKSKLFADPHIKGVVNIDDPYGKKLNAKLKDSLTYGFSKEATIKASSARFNLAGIQFGITFPSGKTYSVATNLLGEHNIYNCLSAASALWAFGIHEKDIVKGLNQPHQIPGRLERVDEGQNFVVVVDYAHTDDALAKALLALRKTRPKRILCLFGAGGDRDRTKRPKMGRVAAEMADYCYVTSDNPRTEDPQVILNEIVSGMNGLKKDNYAVIVDREEAIYKAISDAQEGDVVLLAGKGHEDYQILGNKKIHFSDVELARKAINL